VQKYYKKVTDSSWHLKRNHQERISNINFNINGKNPFASLPSAPFHIPQNPPMAKDITVYQ